MHFYQWLEETGLSVWMREANWSLFSFLALHSLSMALIIGVNVALDLRILGVAPGVPLSRMRAFFPLMWAGVALVVISGCFLLLAYPAKALTNVVFYVKLSCVIAALVLSRYFVKHLLVDSVLDNRVLPTKIKILATMSLLLWTGAIFGGRFLAYTHSVLFASDLIQ